MQFTVYAIAALTLSAVDLYFAVRAFRKPEKVGRALGWSAAFAALITLAYLASVATRNGTIISMTSSLTFIGIDCLLVSLTYFVFLLTGINDSAVSHATNTLLRVLAVADILVLAANVFGNMVVTFELLEPYGVSYQMKTPYVIHLVFTYAMVAEILAVLIYRSAQTPRQYRSQYLLIIAAIGLVVAINAIFLFQDRESFFTRVDCSTFGYSAGLLLMYWTAYDYRENDMANSLSKLVMENVEQGIALFDYEDRLIISNRRAGELLQGVRLEKEMPGAQFRKAVGIAQVAAGDFSVQCDIEGCVPMRCDYRRLTDARGRGIGNLYVFTDLSRQTDLTTGFEYVRDFDHDTQPAAVAVFDIVGLGRVNREQGRDAGDQVIRALAKRMRRLMPEGTAFLRGVEANLIAICSGADEAALAPCAAQVIRESERKVVCGLAAAEAGALDKALETAYRSAQIKKLLDPDSVRSQALSSLVRALKEADADTEDHVRRTQKMGALLGRRVGLADAELTQLELLCLLHDIGKVGIPLEILNKPGKLADQEWQVLRTHPDKGYQIAMSSDELKPIADMIRYHHERWDGNGYPDGLRGEDIPILSRIIAIVDAYDAMVNDRSYRKALPPEKAQAEIRDNAGTQFDPVLAEEFLKLLDAQPELALGEKVSDAEAIGDRDAPVQGGRTGFTAPIPYSRYLLDGDNLIIGVDAQFEVITGYTREAAVGRMHQIDLIPLEDRAYYLFQVSNQLTHGEMAYLRHELQRRDGERVQVACYGRLFFDSAAKASRTEIIIFQL